MSLLDRTTRYFFWGGVACGAGLAAVLGPPGVILVGASVGIWQLWCARRDYGA